MLWTVFMLFMFAWMPGLISEFRVGAIPLVIVLTTMLAVITLIPRSSVQLRKSRRARPELMPMIEMAVAEERKKATCLRYR